jgi:hypothetical protein
MSSRGRFGVSLQETLPLASVVPKQELPSREIWMLAPATATAGVTEMSLREAISVADFPAVALVGLRLSVRKDVCCPAVQVT